MNNMGNDGALMLPSVLIVDDDDTTRMLAKRFLGEAGFDVQEAASGEQGLAVLPEIWPDLLLLDVDMPGVSGFEVCGTIRADAKWRSLPIMMLTASDDLASIEAAYAAGATDFSVKPMNWVLLAHRLRYLLRRAETLTELDLGQRSAAIGSWSIHSGTDAMRWSAQLFDVFGLDPTGTLPTWTFLTLSVPEDEREKLSSALSMALAGRVCDITHAIVRSNDGQRRVVRHRIERMPGKENSSRLHGTVQDITEIHEVAQKVHRLAYYDTMTGLPNRSAFQENLNSVLSRAKRHGETLAVLYIDLDDFKRINDTLGHTFGDQMLSEVAARLRSTVRNFDFVGRMDNVPDDSDLARLGGDEFAVIVSGLESDIDSGTVAQRIRECLAKPFVLGGSNVVRTSSSIGVARFPQDGTDEETLLKHADIAMYEAKRAGKNGVRYHDDELSKATHRRHQLELGLTHALHREELSLVFQPQCSLADDAIVATEALLRWRSAKLGDVSPFEFIPVAEQTGLIVTIGEWVLRTACQQFVAWQEDGHDFDRVAVNVSVKQFLRNDFVAQVSAVLVETGCPAKGLELEITESVLAADADNAIEVLKNLKALGVNLSIDDFGTGYSSLSYLKRFPVDRLKIDRSFVRDIASNSVDTAITSAVIGIARGMGLKVIAEGVETSSQLDALRALGCDEMQGYYLSKPLTPAGLVELLCGARGSPDGNPCVANDSHHAHLVSPVRHANAPIRR